jgi:hypothetical protein
MPISTLLFILLLPRNRKLADSTRHSFPPRVDCEKPTTQHETFLRVFVNVKEYQSKSSSVLSTGSDHAKSEEYWRYSTFFTRRLICDKTRWFYKMITFFTKRRFKVQTPFFYNFTLLLATKFARLFSSLFFYVSRKLRR